MILKMWESMMKAPMPTDRTLRQVHLCRYRHAEMRLVCLNDGGNAAAAAQFEWQLQMPLFFLVLHRVGGAKTKNKMFFTACSENKGEARQSGSICLFFMGKCTCFLVLPLEMKSLKWRKSSGALRLQKK